MSKSHLLIQSKSCPSTSPGHIRRVHNSFTNPDFVKSIVHFAETVEVRYVENSSYVQNSENENYEEDERGLDLNESKGHSRESLEEETDQESDTNSDSGDNSENEGDESNEYYSENDLEQYSKEQTLNSGEVQKSKRIKLDQYNLKAPENIPARHHLPFPNYRELNIKYEAFLRKPLVSDLFTKRGRQEGCAESENDSLHSLAKRPNISSESPILKDHLLTEAFPVNCPNLGKRNRDKLNLEISINNYKTRPGASDKFKDEVISLQSLINEKQEEDRIKQMMEERASGVEPRGEWDGVDELCETLSSAYIDDIFYPIFTQSLGDTLHQKSNG